MRPPDFTGTIESLRADNFRVANFREFPEKSALSAILKTMPDDYDYNLAIEAFEREDYHSAFKSFFSSAETGSSDAQVMLACCYQTGLGVGRDVLEAERWLLKAANQNNLIAWNNLSSLYAQKLPEFKERWGDAQKCWEQAKTLARRK